MSTSVTKRTALALALGVVGLLGGTVSASAQVARTTAPTCTPTPLSGLTGAQVDAIRQGSSITPPGGPASTISGKLFVPAGTCIQASFSAYKLPGAGLSLQPYDQQVLHDNKTATYGPGTYNLTINLPGNRTCSAQSKCIKAELVASAQNADGSTNYTWKITNKCRDKVSAVAFELPDRVKAEDMGWFYRGASGRWYGVLNGVQTAFRSLVFAGLDGINDGESETFTYTLPAGAPADASIRVKVKFGCYYTILCVSTNCGPTGWQADLYFGPVQAPLSPNGHASNTLIYLAYRLANGDDDDRIGPNRLAEEIPELDGAPQMAFGVGQNFPNPFRGRTTVPVSLEQAGPARLEVFDLTGRLVATPLDETLQAGTHSVGIDAAALTPGVYVYRLTAGEGTRTGRMTVTR